MNVRMKLLPSWGIFLHRVGRRQSRELRGAKRPSAVHLLYKILFYHFYYVDKGRREEWNDGGRR